MTEICGRYTEKQISRFIDKELPQKQLWQIHEHLDTCPACRDLAGQFREVTRSFNELAEPPGMGIDPALLHRKLKQPAEG
jgi:anti-sigma factor RsiW